MPRHRGMRVWLRRCNAGVADLLVSALPVVACEGKFNSVASLCQELQAKVPRASVRLQVCRTPEQADPTPPPHPVLTPSPERRAGVHHPANPPMPTPQSSGATECVSTRHPIQS